MKSQVETISSDQSAGYGGLHHQNAQMLPRYDCHSRVRRQKEGRQGRQVGRRRRHMRQGMVMEIQEDHQEVHHHQQVEMLQGHQAVQRAESKVRCGHQKVVRAVGKVQIAKDQLNPTMRLFQGPCEGPESHPVRRHVLSFVGWWHAVASQVESASVVHDVEQWVEAAVASQVESASVVFVSSVVATSHIRHNHHVDIHQISQ